MATLDRLERYEGHLLNWYNTRTLEPLTPRYVSTVDSGNLLVSFWVLGQGCRDVIAAPVLSSSCLRGLADTLAVVRQVCRGDLSMTAPLRELRRLFHGTADGHELIARLRLAAGAAAPVQHVTPICSVPRQPTTSAPIGPRACSAELAAWTAIADRYLRWMETLTYPSDESLDALGQEIARLRRRALHAAPSFAVLANSASARGRRHPGAAWHRRS